MTEERCVCCGEIIPEGWQTCLRCRSEIREGNMNGRQAAKLAGQRVMELERILALNKADIVNYNLCILSMIDGKSPCDWCEDQQECQLQAKGGTGCEEWMLRMPRPEKTEGENESETVLSAGSESGTGTEADQGTDSAL